MKADLKIITLLLIFSGSSLYAQHNAKGFYKDVFMDSGIKLTSRKDLPATRFLNLTLESFYSATDKEGDPLTLVDTLMQEFTMIGSEQDQNGVLLYPDGEPRFRMVYMNGGKASSHGKSLGRKGKAHFQEYVNNGGSYVGSCAGAFLASNGTTTDQHPREDYLNLWGGVTFHSKLYDIYTGMFVEKDSPLLQYYDFGGDMYIDSVWHWGGCHMSTDFPYPEGTVPLLRYDYEPSLKMDRCIHREISSWAYKKNAESGRVVVIGSHPEGVTSGEQLELMSALMRYAMDGNGDPTLKCELQNGVPVKMDRMTVDQDPLHTRIGDRQYHHFKVTVPKRTEKLTVRLTATDPAFRHSLSLYVCPGDFAFNDNASYRDVSLGIGKTLVIEKPEAGVYYISVFGEDTVETEEGAYGTYYTGNLDVLNGIPYQIEVSFR